MGLLPGRQAQRASPFYFYFQAMFRTFFGAFEFLEAMHLGSRNVPQLANRY